MLAAFVITLREGLEAFLIVAISLAYLRKSGQQQLVPAVHWGIALSLVVSVAAAVLFQRASNQALWEGVLALTAAVLVAIAHRAHVAARQTAEGRDRGSSGHLGRQGRVQGDARRVPLHAAHDHARGHGDGAPDGDALLAGGRDEHHRRRRGRHVVRRGRGVALVALWAPREPGALLPGHGRLPGCLRRAAADLRFPRAHRGEPVSLQRAAALGHGALWA